MNALRRLMMLHLCLTVYEDMALEILVQQTLITSALLGDCGSMAAWGYFTSSISQLKRGWAGFFSFLFSCFSWTWTLKNASLIKILFLASPSSRGSHKRRNAEKQAQVSMTDPAEWEGSSAGGVKGEKAPASFFFLNTFPFGRTPVAQHSDLLFKGSWTGKIQLSPGLWLRRPTKATERCLNAWQRNLVLIMLVKKWP